MNELYFFVKYLSILSPLVGIVLFFVVGKHQFKFVGTLLVLLFAGLLTDLVSFSLTKLQVHSVIAVNVYFLMQMILVGIIYSQIVESRFARLITIILGSTCALFIMNTLLFQPLDSIQNINWMISALVIMIITFIHLVAMSKTPVYLIGQFPPFWITTGLFFYCSLSFLILSFSRYLAKNYPLDEFQFVWMFHNIMNIFKNLCFAVAIWWSAKRDAEIDKLITVYDKAS